MLTRYDLLEMLEMRIASTYAAGSDPLTNRPIPNIFALQTDTNAHIRLVIISEGAL